VGAFERLGKFISKRYKLIIAFWILVLLVAIPFAPKVMDALEYNMLAMTPDNMESMQAQQYIDDKFNLSINGFSTIIVFKGDGQNSVLGQDLKEAIFDASDRIMNSEEIPNCTVLSIYTPLLDNYTEIVLNGIVEVNRLTNGTAMLIFGMPSMYPTLWNMTFESGLMFYGSSDLFTLNWMVWRNLEPGANVTEIDAMAYEATYLEIDALLAAENISAEYQDLFWMWYADFTSAWNSTSDDPLLVNNPIVRQERAVNSAYPGFYGDAKQYFQHQGLEELWPYASDIFNLTVEMLDPLDFLDPYRVNDVCHAVVDDIIAPYLDQVPQDLRAPIEDFVDGFRQKWDDNTTIRISGKWIIHVIPDMEQIHQFVTQLVPPLVSALPKAGAEVVQAVYDLGWDGWTNSTMVNQTIIQLTQDTMGQVDDDLVLEVIGMGLNVTQTQVRQLSDDIVMNASLTHYPIPIPDGVLKMLLNVPRNDTMLMTITYERLPDDTYVDGSKYIPQIRDIMASSVNVQGVQVLVSGEDGITYDIMSSSMEDMEKIDPVSIILVIVLIGLFFRSLVSSLTPPMIIAMALVITLMGIFLIATYVMQVTNYVLILVIVTMLGAGCDYCIFILTRYREERIRGKDKKEAVEEAVTWAGESITTSGFTVIVGFGVLSICSYSMVSSIGICLALGIFIALMFALFFLPSLIMLIGDRIFWPTTIQYVRERKENPSKAGSISRFSRRYFEHSSRTSIRHAKALVVASILISIPAIYVVATLDTTFDVISTMPESESKTGVNDIVEGFGGGTMSPVFIAVEFDSRIYNGTGMNFSDKGDMQGMAEEIIELNLSQMFDLRYFGVIEDICDDMSKVDNVREVTSPTRPFGETIDYTHFQNYTLLEQAGYLVMMEEDMSRNGSAIMIQVTMQDQPYSELSISTVNQLRELISDEVEEHQVVVAAYLSGGTALMYDISILVGEEFGLMEVLAIVLIFILLLVVLGAVFTPIRSIVTILMSVFWTLAITALVFEHVLGDQLLWLMPIVLIVVCLGLGMDYDIFLTTRVREEVHKGKSIKDAIVEGVKATGGVITICGLIMAGAFATMTLSGSVMLQEFGFALAFAILLDATVVRMYLVPAMMSMMGKWNWWAPGKLQRTKTDHLVEKKRK